MAKPPDIRLQRVDTARSQSTDRLRRTWPQRFVIVSGLALVVVCLAAAWGLSDAYNSVGEISRYAVADELLEEPVDNDPGGPRNILLVGTTENEGIDADDPLLLGRDDVALADTIMMLRVEPNTGQAVVMSINRDLWIPNVAGYSGKINGAFQVGDIDLLLEVVAGHLDIPINDFAIVNFSGFRQLVDELDGVPIYFEYPAFDEGSFFEIDAGCHVLDGAQALNYVRSRKYTQIINGKKVQDQLSDYTRAERQRDFLLLTMERAIDKGARDPGQLSDMVHAVTDNGAVTLDTQLSPDDLIKIGRAFGDFQPENLQRTALPTLPFATSGGASALRLDDAKARPLLDIFRGLGIGNTFTNADVSVKVIDARDAEARDSGTPRPSVDLENIGINVVSNSVAKTADQVERTVLTYSADQLQQARQLARNLGEVPEYRQSTTLNTLTLTVGSDWQGVTLITLDEAQRAGQLPGDSVAPTGTTTPGSPTSTPPSGEVSGAEDTENGIIGKPPEGVTCE